MKLSHTTRLGKWIEEFFRGRVDSILVPVKRAGSGRATLASCNSTKTLQHSGTSLVRFPSAHGANGFAYTHIVDDAQIPEDWEELLVSSVEDWKEYRAWLASTR